MSLVHPNSVIYAQQFNPDWLKYFMGEVAKMDRMINCTERWADRQRKQLRQQCEGYGVGVTFWEYSTRTFTSFITAAKTLGLEIVFAHPLFAQMSSEMKGESDLDSIRILTDNLMPFGRHAFIMRHTEEGFAEMAAGISSVPLINGGDGPGQHPTQALLDYYTIQKEFGSVDGKKIAMVGDLRFGRTINSLSYLLGRNTLDVELFFVAPPERQISEGIKDFLQRHEIRFHEVDDLHEVAGSCDVVYMTRIQTEREGCPPVDLDQVRDRFSMSPSVVQLLQEHMIIMHPLPRSKVVNELPVEVDAIRQARYFQQARNGIPVRAVLLLEVLFGQISSIPEEMLKAA
jgi:aspartate carbamoyltransferase catalytic subunit